MSALIIKNASKQLRHKPVLENVTLSMSGGRIYGLHGINGSGKTMLLRLMSGLMYADTGSVTWNGKRLGKDLDFPPSMGLLIETPSFIDEFSGFRNLKLVAQLRQVVTDRELAGWMECFELDAGSSKKVGQYSLGMRQRLGLIMAFMEKPQLILLDEPTNALDTDGKKILEREIKRAAEAGSLVVIASHEQDFLEKIADEMYLLKEGRVSEDES